MKNLKTQKVFQNGEFVRLFRFCDGVETVFRDIKKAIQQIKKKAPKAKHKEMDYFQS